MLRLAGYFPWPMSCTKTVVCLFMYIVFVEPVPALPPPPVLPCASCASCAFCASCVALLGSVCIYTSIRADLCSKGRGGVRRSPPLPLSSFISLMDPLDCHGYPLLPSLSLPLPNSTSPPLQPHPTPPLCTGTISNFHFDPTPSRTPKCSISEVWSTRPPLVATP